MADREDSAVYCSTSGTFFKEKDALTKHYKSDFHLYNLKRKVAGLPPVTKEWFDARKDQLSSTASRLPVERFWLDPLTKKKFQTENTYTSFVQSKKYKALVRKSGQPAPEPIIVEKNYEEGAIGGEPSAHNVEELVGDEKVESEWETDSESGGMLNADSEEGEWDVKRSLFDNHLSATFEANLEHMYLHFGFYFPDAEHLKDPRGLIKYLGAKLADGHIPLYCSGMDVDAKRFKSLHAVQRHMIDSNKKTMLFEGNEDEYEDFYDLSYLEEDEPGTELAVAEDVDFSTGGFELVLTNPDTGKERVFGSREFSRYYGQRHRVEDMRESVLAGQVVAKYKTLGIATQSQVTPDEKRARKVARKNFEKVRMKTALRANVNNNLPRNVPY